MSISIRKLPIPAEDNRDLRRRINDTTGLCERSFVRAWVQWNKANSNFLSVLRPDSMTELGFQEPITRAEERICKELMAWLGTNCGMGVLTTALRAAGYELQYRGSAGQPHVSQPNTLPLVAFNLILAWPNMELLYTEEELYTHLGKEWAVKLKNFVGAYDGLIGLTPLGKVIWQDATKYSFCNNEVVSMTPIPEEYQF